MAAATPATETPNHLFASWVGPVRLLFIAYTVLTLVILTLGARPYYRESITICDGPDCKFINITTEEAETLAAAGINYERSALATTIGALISAAVFIGLSVVIYVKRPHEVIAVVTAFAFVSQGGTAGFDYLTPDNLLWELGIRTVHYMAIVFIPAFFFLFPNGRLVPGWSRWVLVLNALIGFGFALLVVLDIWNPAQLTESSTPVFFLALLSQFYRYFRVSSRTERQQTKWPVVAIAILFVVLNLPQVILTGMNVPLDFDVEVIVFGWFAFVAFTLIPLAIMFSILRYGLWDIDFYINRGIVYGVLTALLVGVFVGIFTGLRAALSGVTLPGELGLELVIPTAVVVGLFNPVRRRVRAFVDRRFYGIKLDYYKAAQSYDALALPPDNAERIGGYIKTGVLGSGGMGEVYAAQTPDGRRVAVKVLLGKVSDDENTEKRFIREAQATAALTHPNIVRILDYGEDNGRLYIAMEQINGEDWGEVLKAEGALPLDVIYPRLEEIAAALDHIHANGVIHRDIKPSNIMIEGDEQRAVLMDFGIAKIASQMTVLTGTEQFVGTLDYISPEQIQGKETIDHRADQYSFAVMTYHLLTGQLPFSKANPGATVMAHLMQPPPDATDANPDLSMTTVDALVRGMAKNPADRFASVSAFVAALR